MGKVNVDDFEFEWFSGTGKGGQHRNKHQNCCRVKHIPTGITANGKSQRSREGNKRNALSVCIARVNRSLHVDTERYSAGDERVRTYHTVDNRVVDHSSGLTMSYKEVVEKKNIAPMIEARIKSKMGE